MVGQSVGALRVYFVYFNQTRMPMWELLGAQVPTDGDWMRGVQPIVGAQDDFSRLVEGEVGTPGSDGCIA